MAFDFNATEWAQINAPKGSTRDFNADFAEAVETQEGLRSGMSPNNAVIRGMQARQTRLDPMFELKKSQAMLNIATTAQQFQEGILSSQIKRQQIDDEAADTLAYSQIAGLKTWEEKSEALTKIVPRSAKGINIGTGLRLQLAQLRMQDWSSKAMLSIAQKNPALAMRLSRMDPNSPEFIDAIQEAQGIDNKPQGIAITLPSGRTVEAVYNAKGGGYTLVADPEAKLEGIRDQLDAKEKSTLSLFYNKEAAKLEAEAADLERGTDRDKKDAAGLRAQAQTYRQKLSSFGEPVAPATPTNVTPTVNFIFKDGKLVPAR